MTGPCPDPLLWSPDRPGQCACGYQVRRNGRLIVREPADAWAMKEKTRDSGCLTERVRALGRFTYGDLIGYQHTHRSVGSYKGFPDVHLWPLQPDTEPGGGTHVFLELKQMGEDPSPDQVSVMGQLARLSPVYLVRPCCILAGTVDAIIVLHYGGPVRSSYRGVAAAPAPAGAARPAAAQPAGLTAAQPLQPPRRRPPVDDLPGSADVPDVPDAVGYVVPMPGGDGDVRHVEAWVRAVGFDPLATRYPLRFVVAPGVAIVQVSAGRAVAGRVPPRQWRWLASDVPFPDHLAVPLRMSTVAGSSTITVMRIIEARESDSLMRTPPEWGTIDTPVCAGDTAEP